MSRAPPSPQPSPPPPLGRPASAPSPSSSSASAPPSPPVSASWGPSPTCSSSAASRSSTLNIVSFNCNGLRSASMKGNHPLSTLFAAYAADVFCFQETKLSGWSDVEAAHGAVPGYDAFFSFSRARKGWSGVATYVREGCTIAAQEDLGDTRTDGEGRVMRTDHGRFVLFNVYFPNAGRPDRLGYKLSFYACIEEHVRALVSAGRHVLVVGDVNTAHRPIDMWTDQYRVHSGCLPVERAWMDGIVRSDLCAEKDRANRNHAAPFSADASSQRAAAGAAAPAESVTSNYVDLTFESESSAPSSAAAAASTFATASSLLAASAAVSPTGASPPPLIDSYRYLYPARRGAYTWWDVRKGHRETNDGWRIDYMLVDAKLRGEIQDAEIHARQRGSDHCPTSLHLQLPLAFSPAPTFTAATSSSPSPPDASPARLARLGRFLSSSCFGAGVGPLSFPFPSAVCSVSARGKSKFQRQNSLQSFFAKTPPPTTSSSAAAAAAASASPTITAAAAAVTQTKRKADQLGYGAASPPSQQQQTPCPTNALAALRAPPSSGASPTQQNKKARSARPPPSAATGAAASTARAGPSIADLFQRKPQ